MWFTTPFDLGTPANAGTDRKGKGGAQRYTCASMPYFFSLQVAMFFLIFFFAITSCKKVCLSSQKQKV